MKGRPLLPPLARFFLYLIACSITFVFGSCLGLLPLFVWLNGQGKSIIIDLSQLAATERGLAFLSITTVTYPLLIGLTTFFIFVLDRRSPGHFGLTLRGWGKKLTLGYLWAIIFVTLTFSFYGVTGMVEFSPLGNFSLPFWLITTLWLYPLIGFTEEVIFRGYMLTVLEEWRGKWVAISVTSALFWFVHFGQGNIHEPLGLIAMFLIGIIFALTRYVTGSLWFPIGLHAGYNWFAITFGGDPGLGLPVLFRFEPKVPEWLIGPPGHVGVLDILFEVLLLLSIVVLLPKVIKLSGSFRRQSEDADHRQGFDEKPTTPNGK